MWASNGLSRFGTCIAGFSRQLSPARLTGGKLSTIRHRNRKNAACIHTREVSVASCYIIIDTDMQGLNTEVEIMTGTRKILNFSRLEVLRK